MKTLSIYVFPVSLGQGSTTEQHVLRIGGTTTSAVPVPVRILDLQKDLDRFDDKWNDSRILHEHILDRGLAR